MITFTAAKKVDAVSMMKSLNRYNGSDTELRIKEKPISVTFLRSSATGTAEQDELELEFVWRVQNTKILKNAYNFLRSAINKDVRVSIGTVEFRARIADTTKFEPHTDLEEMLNSKFAISFNSVHDSMELKTSTKKDTLYISIPVPDNIMNILRDYPDTTDEPETSTGLPPHITVSILRDVDDDKLAEIISIIHDTVSNFFGLDIKVQGSCRFEINDDEYPYVALVDCLDLSKFKTDLDERLEELDPTLVDTKFPEYIPHIALFYKDTAEQAPVIKPVAWRANEILIEHNGNKEMIPFGSNIREEFQDPCPDVEKHDEEPDLHWADSGYQLVNELENMHYYTAAAELRNIMHEISTKQEHPIARRLRLIAGSIIDLNLSERCIRVAEELTLSTEDRVRDALMPFVDPAKMDEALNSVIEVINVDDGEEVEGMGPGMPGVDHHINVRVKAPQTMEIPSGAPEISKAVEFGKRNF